MLSTSHFFLKLSFPIKFSFGLNVQSLFNLNVGTALGSNNLFWTSFLFSFRSGLKFVIGLKEQSFKLILSHKSSIWFFLIFCWSASSYRKLNYWPLLLNSILSAILSLLSCFLLLLFTLKCSIKSLLDWLICFNFSSFFSFNFLLSRYNFS